MRLKRIFNFLVFGLGVLLAFIILTNLVVYIKSKPYIYKTVEDSPEAQAVLIPGAAVFSSGKLSDFFEERVKRGLELYKAKKVSKILVSGDNSTVSHNEVNPVRDYLIKEGVPAENIFLDHTGFDTYSTMYRARDIFQVDSIVIVTQSFHLPRAVFIARNLGIEAYGLYPDEGRIAPSNYIREIFANEKAVLNLLFNSQPKFLGDTIPITGVQNPNSPPDEEVEDTKNAESGFISGHVTIGPFCPVEREGEPCKVPPEAYTSREAIVYAGNETTVKERVRLDTQGNYKVTLAPGNYFIQIEPAGIGPGEKKKATVKSKQTTVVDFDIDTGIR